MGMKNIYKFLFLILFLPANTGIHAGPPEYTAEPLPFAQALSSREITALYQDREGFIWAGTTYGVARYDGFETVVFKSDHITPGRLTHNSITPLTDTEHYVFIGTKSGLNIFDKRNMRLYPTDNKEFLRTEIQFLFTDSRQQVWVSTPRGLFRCDEQLHILQHYNLGTGAVSLYEDHDRNLWILTWGKGLFRRDNHSGKLVAYPAVGSENIPFILFQDKERRYWLGTWGNGLYRFHPEQSPDKQFEPMDCMGRNEIVFDITQDDHSGRLWILSYRSLSIFECTPDGPPKPVEEDTGFDRNKIFSKILKDREGNLWLGAYDQGYYLSFNHRPLKGNTLPTIKEQTGFDANINCMYEDEDGIIWFEQERSGIALYNAKTGECRLTPCPASPGMEVHFIVPSRQPKSAWTASQFIPTVFRARRNGMQIQLTDTLELTVEQGKKTGHIIGIHEDCHENVWVLTEHRLFVFDKRHRPLTTRGAAWNGICSITETPDGSIWLGTQDGELLRTHTENGHIDVDARYKCPKVLNTHNTIRFLCHGNKDNVWIATDLGGLYEFIPTHRKLVNHTAGCLQQEAPILNLLSSGPYIWVTTPSATIRYNPASQRRQVYSTADKHNPVHTYRNTASCTGQGRQFHAGGHGGFITLFPDTTAGTAVPSNLRITDIRVAGKSILQNNSATTFTDGNVITFPPGASHIELTFSDCLYDRAAHSKVAYQLEGWDAEPFVADRGQHAALYNHLPKGDYTFRLYATDDAGRTVGSPVSYHIRRLPAWYETWYAYLIYITAGVLLFTFGIRSYTAGIRRKNARLLREELARTKLEYFTSVSHELLTPLTILSCLSDEIEEKQGADRHFIRAMRDNTARLKKLIKQILDFRKIEKNHLPLQVRYGDAADFIRRIGHTDFTLLAQKKHIAFRMQIHPHEIYGFYDADKLEEMLFNLLSNAIKYTPEEGSAGIDAGVEHIGTLKMLYVEVWDEGIGIPEAEQDKIFTRFYRSPQKNINENETNGIGLSLTQELVRLHHGTISLQSQPKKGSRFRLSIPLSAEAYSSEEIVEEKQEPADISGITTDSGQDRPALLIVDDNHEITEAIERLLGKHYRITSAHNATQAETVIREKDIELIVCDFMMPDTSGIELCRRIKNDLATSHIPVIMLTAQNTDETRRECYEAGADGFIAKPFETKVLMARVDNLLNLYRQHRTQFLKGTDTDTTALPYRSHDRNFLDEIVSAIENHLQDSDFNLESLAGTLRLSKSTMNRKIKSMTGLTPMDFVKNIRIKMACKLLRQADMNISEVAYAVGFSDPKYFAKCFKDECGLTPSQFQQKPA